MCFRGTVLNCSLFFSCLVYGEFFSTEGFLNIDDASKMRSSDSTNQYESTGIIMMWNEEKNEPEVAGVYYPDREANQLNFKLLWTGKRYYKDCMAAVSNEGVILDAVRSRRCVSSARRFIRQFLLNNEEGFSSENKALGFSDLFSNEDQSEFVSSEILPQEKWTDQTGSSDSTNQYESTVVIMMWNEERNEPEVAGMYYPDREENQSNFELIWTGKRYYKDCMVAVSNEGVILDFPVRSRRCVSSARRFIHQFFLRNERFTDNNGEKILSENRGLEFFDLPPNEDKSEFVSSQSEILPQEKRSVH